MWSYVRTSLVLVSLFLFLYVSEAGLLREQLLSNSKIDGVYSETRSDTHWPGRMNGRSLARYQNYVNEKKGVPSDGYRAKSLQQGLFQCRYGSCGK